MSKTVRKFSKKEKKTQQRRKTKGKKYGGNDSCTIGNVKVKELTPGDGPNCSIGDELYNIRHKEQLVECFNKIAPDNSYKINL
jgi:hypothetical protein